MDLQGERFTLDLEDHAELSFDSPPTGGPTIPGFVGDIMEREVKAPKPPSAPTMKKTTTGFPEHKKRTRPSAFKQQRESTRNSVGQSALSPTPSLQTTLKPTTFEEKEKQAIDAENKQRVEDMSRSEIEREQKELYAGLPSSLIERLLKRANIDENRGDTGLYPESDISEQRLEKEKDTSRTPSDVLTNAETPRMADPEAVPIAPASGRPVQAAKSVRFVDDDEPPQEPIGLQAADSAQVPSLDGPQVHFPTANAPPELDPTDPSFLENLHEKYFPSLPVDPSKLAWMAPLPTHGSPADRDSSYYPGNEAISASALRFDFRGGMLPPRIARAVPVNRGLHHHGEAPEAAGYTVPELARLARSAYPAQRCLAFQTLGRFLYRLGRGEFGNEKTEMGRGLWQCVRDGRVLDTLQDAANAEGGHQGSKAYAIEAVWLWQKGGGKGEEKEAVTAA